jgi:formamidopyrimidine-DNA glycosylase
VPELPEVEVVRIGLQAHVAGREIAKVEVLHERAIRRHVLGADDFTGRLAGTTVNAARRRGKYLWLELSDGEAVLAHLGMSGQMLVQPESVRDEKHLRVRVRFADEGPELRFVDQRTFGGLALSDLVEVDGDTLPGTIAHIARDPMDPKFDPEAALRALRSRRTEVKRALLDQTLISGVGNIYADEALWRAKLHWARSTTRVTNPQGRALISAATDVMNEALIAGGTSFDALYVNINGESGYFDRSLDAYGQEGLPCGRCGTPIRRDPFMNRSSFSCPKCQPRPRT